MRANRLLAVGPLPDDLEPKTLKKRKLPKKPDHQENLLYQLTTIKLIA